MASNSRYDMVMWLPLCLVVALLVACLGGCHGESTGVYVVYMGAVPPRTSPDFLRQSHIRLVGTILKRGKVAQSVVVQQYKHAFSGFAARLSKDEAAALRHKPGVVSVFADPVYQLHTTRSWDFLQQTDVKIDSARHRSSKTTAASTSAPTTETIIGLLTPASGPSPPASTTPASDPSRASGRASAWPGMTSTPPTATRTAKGIRRVEGGHVPRLLGRRLRRSAILAGFDDAIGDGVDVVSVSSARRPTSPDFSEDPIAIGSFHAVAKGVMVVCSAGNAGPDASTVVNAAPWIMTVAATTIDRDFESDVVLGGNRSAVKGGAINFSNLDKSKYPLIAGASAKSSSASSTSDSASHCEPGTLDASKIKGKIVLCNHSQSDTSKMVKVDDLQSAGAVGSILVNDFGRAVTTAYLDFPVTEVTPAAAADLYKYIASTSEPVATITPTITVTEYKPAPVVAYFVQGPSAQTGNILKPDVAAPGVNILASWIPTSSLPAGQKQPSQFNLVSGTSMACPHVAGAAATVKAWNPTWSPAAIRSAIMTTSTQLNNDKAPMTTDAGTAATPFDYGAGQVNPTGALDPGLVYDLAADDYLNFLCNYGYGASQIKLITSPPAAFSCAGNASKDLISDLNYPSIAITGLAASASRTVTREVTNVGAQEDATYTVTVSAPAGLEVKVVPSKLQFTGAVKKLAFQVTFSGKNTAAKGALTGSITWSDGKHTVHSPFAVSS
ncbi:hypothetical protein ZWY2020_013234 [Hordeum vulgare]|nr:hypothetical protein ZWY2020_013234 [Hordeum vulgare]